MERLGDIFTIDLKKMPDFNLVVIQKERKRFLALKVLHEFSDELISTIKKHKDLIGKPRQIDLFHTESLQDHFNKTWFYKGAENKNMVRAIEDALQALYEDTKRAKIFYQMKEGSDEQLISQLFKCFPGEDVNLERLKRDELISLNEILNEIRNYYDIQRCEAIDLDDFILLAGEKYLMKHLPNIEGVELKRIAFKSKTVEAFKKNIFSLIDSSSNPSFIDGKVCERDGYLAKSKGDIESPVIEISYLGACYLYKGSDAVPYYTQEYILEQHNFWSEVWYELKRGYEKYLLNLKNEKLFKLRMYIQQLEDRQKKLGYTDRNLREGFSVTQLSVAKSLNVSTTTVAKDEKKALGIIKEYMHKKGVGFEDLICA